KWKLWGLIHRRGKDDDEDRCSSVSGVGRSYSESWQDGTNGINGGMNRNVFRSNSSVSMRSSSLRKTNGHGHMNGKVIGNEQVFERNRSARYSPNHIDNGLLRFYLAPLSGSRRGGIGIAAGKSRGSSNNSHSIARTVEPLINRHYNNYTRFAICFIYVEPLIPRAVIYTVEEVRVVADGDVPGGSIQTREYYLDSSSSKRRKSLDRSNSIRKMAAAVVAELDESKVKPASGVSNSKVSPTNEPPRVSNSNSLRDDCGSETFELGFRDNGSVGVGFRDNGVGVGNGYADLNDVIEENDDVIVDVKPIKDLLEECSNSNDNNKKKMTSSRSNFWSAASVLSKKWQKWRRKQKKGEGEVMTSSKLPVEKPISRQYRETQHADLHLFFRDDVIIIFYYFSLFDFYNNVIFQLRVVSDAGLDLVNFFDDVIIMNGKQRPERVTSTSADVTRVSSGTNDDEDDDVITGLKRALIAEEVELRREDDAPPADVADWSSVVRRSHKHDGQNPVKASVGWRSQLNEDRGGCDGCGGGGGWSVIGFIGSYFFCAVRILANTAYFSKEGAC
nr:hypothetical protein [Tanacetum cinerariifolium]